MKKYIYSICLIIVIGGCQKLDLNFNTRKTPEQIQESFNQVEMLLTNIYADLPDGLFQFGDAMMASASDEAEFTLETNSVQYFNTGSWNNVNNPDNAWQKYYMAIRKVNNFLPARNNINLDLWKLNPNASQQAVYQQNLAKIIRWGYEARFLRAYFYFELIKRYGGVPLINQSLSLNEDFTKLKRNTLEECINFITSECDSAAANLPLTTGTTPYIAANDLGRATKLAALSLKSRVLLYAASDLFNTTTWAGGYAKPEYISMPAGDRPARWKAAADAAKAVIDAAGTVVLGDYKSLFGTSNFSLPEVIFARRYGALNNFETANTSVGFDLGKSGNTPSQNLVDAYEVKVDAATSKKFDWSDATLASNPYANRDPRLGISIVVNASTFGNTSNTRKVQIWSGGLDGPPRTNATKTGYYLRKYVQENLNLTQGQTALHTWILFRFPEIYLNYAEALNEYSPGVSDIKIYYDKSRTRVGVAMPGLTTGMTQSDVREKIRNEKRVELAFEDHRIWDVKRWMIAPETIGAPIRGVQVSPSNTYTPFTLENRVFAPKMYLYPIPLSDININGNLDQNPMW